METTKLTEEQVIQGFVYAKDLLNSIAVSGISNCQKLAKVYNNIDVFLSIINSGELILQINNEKTSKK